MNASGSVDNPGPGSPPLRRGASSSSPVRKPQDMYWEQLRGHVPHPAGVINHSPMLSASLTPRGRDPSLIGCEPDPVFAL
ncbi:hypothetical protein PBY51_014551 [Eleginops maclovinus]|uniref:Uncharacterized protein n=1 Tax=Eleginops maclovinus TaxID=56733 RepID=A0AAN8AC39_ELEMC|nr:hypothetical protein PBY51_014551 [Eleginops maclovinus]